MFKRFSLLALFICAFALSSSAPAQAKDSAAQAANRRAIVASYSALDRAFVKKDAAVIMLYFAPDFTSHSQTDGVFDRAGFERVIRTMEASDTQVTFSETKITELQWRGPDAIIWTSSKHRMKSGRGTLSSWENTRHYWGKINGKWQIRQEVALAYNATLNGKPLR